MDEEILADFFDLWEENVISGCPGLNQNKSRGDLHCHSSFLIPNS